ncbi:hypothetical protein HARCEL1_12755 [Halococcoides cellulosivorans]|uniref:Uncharacterized protein n=2 Tax=Halococcoides cellulosivorans TaxID=1679096 RepID=A0A2R4X3Y0_9EURY|nr:hypothetical protein HARCEL1_12755 [Halococcoides cellulosivorans]
MAISSDNETRQTNELVVEIRIPDGSDGDLVSEAERRLSRVDGIVDVSIDELRSLDPGLSATEITVAVTVETVTGAVVSPEDEVAIEIVDRGLI